MPLRTDIDIISKESFVRNSIFFLNVVRFENFNI